ncbi:MAG TPA: 3-deoxy-8-phosphooctulonate synthase, partial [Gemmatimonadetes bacterium]|nr:3-deoxy-8-phosphooctulonate synthase [Gemmatimonadota bacterium]
MFDRFTLITGPCLLETDELNLEIARAVKGLGEAFALPVIFKASFDKANRSQMDSARGPGITEGLQRLGTVKQETGLALLTDVHEPQHAERAAAVVDVLQIPAFLCRQTDLLLAAGGTGKPVNVKKGQWMSPDDMAGAVDK